MRPATYYLQIQDAYNCSQNISSITITAPIVVGGTVSSTNVTCYGLANGTITVTGTGGTSPYAYDTSNTYLYFTNITGSFTPVPVGSYPIRIIDANLCSTDNIQTPITTVNITQPPQILLSITDSTYVSCIGGSDGSLTISVSNGYAPFTGAGVHSGLSHGSYTFTVTDSHNCTATISDTVGIVHDVTPPVISCNGGNYTVNNDPDNCSANVTVATPTVSDNCSVFNNALNFDGVNDYVENTSFSLASPAAGFTIEGWMNLSNLSNYNASMATQTYNNFPAPFDMYTLNDNSGNIVFYLGNGNSNSIQSITTSTGISANTWEHVACVYDGSNAYIYINGVLSTSGAISVTVDNYAGAPFRVGDRMDNLTITNGTLDEVRVWSVARTQVQIQTYMNEELNSQPGLEVVYHFDQGVAGGNNTAIPNVTDNSGNGYNGTLNNFALTGSTSNFVSGAPAIPNMLVSNDYNNTPNASGTYPVGTTTVHWTATDASGNTASCSQTVTVKDNQAPAITCPNAITINTNVACTSTRSEERRV